MSGINSATTTMASSSGTTSPNIEIDRDMAKLMRPYMRLAKALGDDFMKTVERWHHLVSQYGYESVPAPPSTRAEFEVFYGHCHAGWKLAQQEIAEFLIAELPRLAEAKADEKRQHAARDPAARSNAKAARQLVEGRIAVARRMLDVALWTIMSGDHSTLRRLLVKGGQHSLSVANIKDAMGTADELNKDPMTIALCCDMLSLVHVGDLVVRDARSGSTTFMELKLGDKNAALAQAADLAVKTQCQAFESFATSSLDAKDLQHFARAKRQAQRNNAIINILENEGGDDPFTGGLVQIQRVPPAQTWAHRVAAAAQALTSERQWAFAVIEDCVYLGIYTDPRMAFVGFQGWLSGRKCTSPVVNFLDSFRNPAVRPLGAANMSYELRLKVLRGEVLVMLCLDVHKLIELGNKMQPGYMRLGTRADGERARSSNLRDFDLDGRPIICTVNDQEIVLGAGTRDRILFDFHSPSQLLRNYLDHPLHERGTIVSEEAQSNARAVRPDARPNGGCNRGMDEDHLRPLR